MQYIRRMLLASVGSVIVTGAALAADLPATAPPPVFASPVFSWTGLYVGLNAGYHFGGSSTKFTGTDTDGGGLGTLLANGIIPTTGAAASHGFIGGAQIGYNWQFNSFVLGVEADIDGATGRRRVRTVRDAFPFVPVTFESTQKLNWLGTLRARLGWTPIDRWLIYATGGFAFGESTASFSVVSPAAVPPIAATSTSKAKTGWVLGGGVEYAVTNNWIVRGEYLHYDLGRKSSRITYNYPPDTSTLTGHTRHSGDIARVGVNYKF